MEGVNPTDIMTASPNMAVKISPSKVTVHAHNEKHPMLRSLWVGWPPPCPSPLLMWHRLSSLTCPPPWLQSHVYAPEMSSFIAVFLLSLTFQLTTPSSLLDVPRTQLNTLPLRKAMFGMLKFVGSGVGHPGLNPG